MPLVIHPRIRKGLRRIAAFTALACFAGPAAAQAACPTVSTAKTFQAFGDSSDYFLAPSGSFESGAAGWSLPRASVVSGNESSKGQGFEGSKSLAINALGTAVSPSFCVGVEHPMFRLFARRTSGTWGTLNVKLRWTDSTGATNETVVGSIGSSDTAWHATGRIALSTVLPLWKAGQTASVQLVFDPEDYGGAWAIDDVYIDPYRTG
jgi:hypothetical protein